MCLVNVLTRFRHTHAVQKNIVRNGIRLLNLFTGAVVIHNILHLSAEIPGGINNLMLAHPAGFVFPEGGFFYAEALVVVPGNISIQ